MLSPVPKKWLKTEGPFSPIVLLLFQKVVLGHILTDKRTDIQDTETDTPVVHGFRSVIH